MEPCWLALRRTQLCYSTGAAAHAYGVRLPANTAAISRNPLASTWLLELASLAAQIKRMFTSSARTAHRSFYRNTSERRSGTRPPPDPADCSAGLETRGRPG